MAKESSEVKDGAENQNAQPLKAVKATYKREELIAHAESALGVPSYVAAGALTDSEYTVSAAKKEIESFKKKEVK